MAQAVVEPKKGGLDVRRIPIDSIAAIGNLRETNDKELQESGFVDSVRAQGVIEPVLVRPLPPADANLDVKVQAPYQLVLGFRRHRAAHLAKLKEIPAEVRDMTDAEVTEVQLVENLQRKDLGPLEEARAYEAWMKLTGLGQNQLGAKIGKSQSHVAKRVALLRLPEDIRGPIQRGIIMPAHAEVLAKIPEEATALRKQFLADAAQGTPAKELDNQLDWRLSNWKREKAEQVRLSKWKAGLKFPACPTCKKPAVSTLDTYLGFPTGAVTCDSSGHAMSHAWNPTTGEVVHRKRKKGEAPEKAARPNILESPVTRSAHPVPAILAAMMAAIPEEDLKLACAGALTNDQEIEFWRDNGKGLGLPDVALVPVKYSTGERTLVWVTGADSRSRRAAKDRWATWARKHLPKPRKPKAPTKKVDEDVLIDHGVASTSEIKKIPGRLDKFAGDPEALEIFRDLETDGEKRYEVLVAIDDLLRALTEW